MPKSKQNKWNVDFLRELDKLPLEEAKSQAISLLEGGTTRDNRKSHLIKDISASPTAAEVSRIMYNAYLSGSGMGSFNSKWSQTYGRAS